MLEKIYVDYCMVELLHRIFGLDRIVKATDKRINGFENSTPNEVGLTYLILSTGFGKIILNNFILSKF